MGIILFDKNHIKITREPIGSDRNGVFFGITIAMKESSRRVCLSQSLRLDMT